MTAEDLVSLAINVAEEGLKAGRQPGTLPDVPRRGDDAARWRDLLRPGGAK
jgi:hypothetical protein